MAYRKQGGAKPSKGHLKHIARNAPKPQENIVREAPKEIERRTVEIPSVIGVKEFADILKLPVTKVIAALMKNGVIANINESIDSETAMIIGDELNFDVIESQGEEKEAVAPEALVESEEDKSNRIPRPPVVTVMGHVDHGKTTLLDTIRRTSVAATESGGITQHIGAYQVPVNAEGNQKRLITFLDTPGHEAFSAMRAHGANITDIVVLVVAANDGVKPQTVEAINHAKVANVPIIVAINKIDVPGANPERVKQELAERDLVPEEWGGKTIMVPISAKTGENVSNLLSMILLTADLKNLTTNPNKKATGVVIESHMHSGVGPLATILINDGTLSQSDTVVVGDTYGKIRFMEDYKGKRIKSGTASTPVQIAGLNAVPDFGELVISVESEKAARQMTLVKSIVRQPIGHIDTTETAQNKDLNIILKADVQGSLEALKESIANLGNAEVRVVIVSEGVGDITDTDINLAEAANAIVVGFRTSIKPQVRQLAERKNVQISIYEVIYQLFDDISASLSGLLEPEKIEVKLGVAHVLKIFLTNKGEQIIGVKVEEGHLKKNDEIKIVRDKEILGEAKIISIHRGQDEVESISAGTECGLNVKTDLKVEEGDNIEAYQIEEKIRTLD